MHDIETAENVGYDILELELFTCSSVLVVQILYFGQTMFGR